MERIRDQGDWFVSDEKKDMRDKFIGYADGVTAFATAQAGAFSLLLGQGDCFARNVIDALWTTVSLCAVAYSIYFWFVFRCHRLAQDLGWYPSQLAPFANLLRTVRYVIIGVDLVVNALLPILIWVGVRNPGLGHFSLHCGG